MRCSSRPRLSTRHLSSRVTSTDRTSRCSWRGIWISPTCSPRLSKLKGSIDGVKADGEESKIKNEKRFAEISSAICAIGGEIEGIKGNCESYEEVCRQRESLRLILEGQIDMLYAIFMTSALPQYQKDEIGERISRMREELKNYGSSEEN